MGLRQQENFLKIIPTRQISRKNAELELTTNGADRQKRPTPKSLCRKCPAKQIPNKFTFPNNRKKHLGD